MKKRILSFALALTMTASLLAACGSKPGTEETKAGSASNETGANQEGEAETYASSTGGENPVKGGVLTISLASSPKHLDPINYTGVYESQIIAQVCDRLVEYNQELSEITPSLATEWTVSEDGKVYTFKIREGVKFHKGEYQEGRELTAEDVAYSLNRSAKESSLKRLDMLESAEATGDYEVVCTLKNPDAAFLTALTDAGNSIVPKEEVEGHGDAFGENLVGSGPFMMKKFELDQQTELVKNADYWLVEPNLDGVVFKVVSDSNQAVNALKAGEIQMATDLVGEAVQLVKDDESIVYLEKTGLHVAYIYFNQANGPTADKRVREALIKGVDVEKMTNAIYQYGEASPATLPLPPGSWGYDESLESTVPTFDPEAAKELLKEAGYDENNKLELNLYISNAPARKTMAEIFKNELKQNLGVEVTINVNEWGPFSEVASSGKADIYCMSWTWYPDPFFFLNKLFASSEIGALGNGQGFSNEEVDKLLADALLETDQAKRAELYKQALALIVAELPGIYYANENVIYGVAPQLKDFSLRADKTIKLVTPEGNAYLEQ